jgi:hypothetical protein
MGSKANRQREVEKAHRSRGLSYKGLKKRVNGKYRLSETKAPRVMGPPCSCKPGKRRRSFFCSDFNENDRAVLFKNFWSMDWAQRKVYVAMSVKARTVSSTINPEKDVHRKNTLVYCLTIGNEQKRVCKEMYLSTLNIGEWSVHSWAKNSTEGMHPARNANEHNVNASRQMSASKAFAVDYLRTLPKMPSHYCRANSSKLYLEPVFDNMSHLYKQYCAKACEGFIGPALKPCSIKVFRDIFNDLNLSLFNPKKDQCDLCCTYEAGNLAVHDYENHCLRKECARNEKARDKENNQFVFTMDLQSVLLAPRVEASAMYYKTKLCVHNFTFFDLHSKAGYCYVWHEGEGGLSSNEFASCICDFIQNLNVPPNSVITLWSDGCTYQNRNVVLANALLVTCKTLGITVVQKYLVRGHTQMECDSMHARIETKLKRNPIHVPADYLAYFTGARTQPTPYSVKSLTYEFFKNYASIKYLNSIRPGVAVGDPTVTDIVAIEYTPLGVVNYKLDFSDEWQPLARRLVTRNADMVEGFVIGDLYAAPLKIKTEKFVHLQQLKSVLHKDYHAFYDSLPHVCCQGQCPHIIS